MIQGCLTALITPFRNGTVDEQAFASLIERQITAGVAGLVPAGTTGESATLSFAEHERVIELCVTTARGRVPVLAGCGANATAEAIVLTRHAKAVGADAAMLVAPYYNRPNQDGIVAHFLAVAEAVELPLIVYNIPSRTGVDIAPETLARIARHPNVIGLKDSSGDPARTQRHRALCGPEFLVLCGDDPLALAFAAYGARGIISVASNVAPGLCARLQGALALEDFAGARVLNDRLAPLARALFADASPAPTKHALAALGLIDPELRLPLVPASGAARAAVDAALAELGAELI